MANTFTEATLVEALARQVRVYLIDKPSPNGRDNRMVSRLVGACDDGKLIVEVPRSGDQKVFIPDGAELGLSFSLADVFVQARTIVRGHCLLPGAASHRIDVLLVDRPEHLLIGNRRQHARVQIETPRFVPVSIWARQLTTRAKDPRMARGRLVNFSSQGFGVALPAELDWPTNTDAIVRMEEPEAPEWRLYHAVLVHCTRAGGTWLAGFDHVMEIGPGEATAVLEKLMTKAPAENSDD